MGDKTQMSKLATRLAFLLLVIGGGITVGILTGPGEWYANLNKPAFNPPNWIFGPVWTVLYVLIALAGWRTFENNLPSLEMKIWWVQLGLNFVWSPVFFVLHQPWVALGVIVLLLTTIIIFIRRNWVADRVSAVAFIPYLLWVGFASILNLSIAVLN
ncbi:TspO/MBR family protein [Ruegeria arenilitoris]|uniref:TspO/MBR family protein n=1 Tax=Ruegeria arenilitoris TaxID=1173585 RepID=UPI0020C2A40C|nr:TspO/MBR family protein [Ruegeria arenilitoris]